MWHLHTNEMDSETSSKKSKRSKVKMLKELDEVSKKVDDKGLLRKQNELMRVLHVKNFQLQNGNLSYMDYLELKDELFRLNALKDMFTNVSRGNSVGFIRE